MAYNPISTVPIQYSKTDGTPANGYYLKFYVANSTTPISMQTDSGGATSLAKCKLNEYGFPISNPNDENSVFIPHLLDTYTAYRFVIYASAADADSNTVTPNLPNVQSVKVNQSKAEADDLRADLSATGGAALIGTAEGTNVQTEIDTLQSSVTAISSDVNVLSGIAIGIVPRASSILIIGDSVFGSGIGATAQKYGMPWMLARSILNNSDHGEHKDRGKLYHIQLNSYPSGGGWTEQGVTTGGGVVPVANTVSNYCYSVPSGGWIEITNRAFQSVDVFYDAALSTTGTMTTTRNGVTVSTLPITNGTGVVNTLTIAASPNYLRPSEGNINTFHSDVIRLTFSQPCRLKSIIATQQTYEIQPFVTVCGREGGALDNYIYASHLDELAAYLNFNALTGTNGTKLMIIGFGLNDIYFRRYSPSQYTAYLSSMISGISSRVTNVKFMVMAPFQGDESRLPGLGITIPTAYPYADYITALKTWCEENDVFKAVIVTGTRHILHSL